MTRMRGDLQSRLLATFRVEADEHLRAIEADLRALDGKVAGAGAAMAAESLFRAVHTLKGAARSVGLADVEALCQASESVLRRITRGEAALSQAIVEGLKAISIEIGRFVAGAGSRPRIQSLIAALNAAGDRDMPVGPGAAPAAAPAAPETPKPAAEPDPVVPAAPVDPQPASAAPPEPAAAQAERSETVRVATKRLDMLMGRAEDLLLPQLVVGERVRQAKAVLATVRRSRLLLARAGGRTGPAGDTGGGVEMLRELRAIEGEVRQLAQALQSDAKIVQGTIAGALEEIRALRMMPAATVFEAFPRMIDDLAQSRSKSVEWSLRGGDLLVDRMVLEIIKDALVHILRNAIDHGIETVVERRAAGKPTPARLRASVVIHDGSRLEISVEDDGRGIDLSGVRDAAVRARIVTAEEARRLPDEAALDLIFRSGLSTSPIVTDISGHGIGLAVVRERIERLDGQMRVRSRPGEGTTFEMLLPVSVATSRGILVGAAGKRVLLPMDAVEGVVRLAADGIDGDGPAATVAPWRGRMIALSHLDRVLDLPRVEEKEARRHRQGVVIRYRERVACFLVDEMIGEREILLKELGWPLRRVRCVAAGGILGTGEVVPVLRPADLVALADRGIPEASRRRMTGRAALQRRTVLVVDDSMTTRSMESNLFETAGFVVRTAVDGLDAWTLLMTESVDIVVSDVDMPRMNGFELTERIRGDARLAELPVVLVTALESREDKERGIAIGANAYVIKSAFDQSSLLEIIGRLL